MVPNEEEAYDGLGALLRRHYGASEPTNRFLEQLHAQLLSELAESHQPRVQRSPTMGQSVDTARPWNRITRWIGGLDARWRIALGGIGVAIVLGLLLVWAMSLTKPVSAMEKMAKSIHQAKSYKCVQIVRQTYGYGKPGEPHFSGSTYIVYWLAPGSARTETTYSNKWKGPGPEVTSIRPAGKPGIWINHRTKTYRRYPATLKAPYSSAFDDLEDLGRFSGKADRELGTKEVNGKKARGFQIEMEKMTAGDRGPRKNPAVAPGTKKTVAGDSPRTRLAEIWLDPDSNLPVLVRYTGMKLMLASSAEQEVRDIQWNIDLDPKLFDTTPPKGYTDVTPKLTLDEQVRQITEALKIWAEANAGHYPRSSGGPVYDEFCKIFSVASWRTAGVTKEKSAKAKKAIAGIDLILHIRAYSPEFAYNGKIGPKDKDKVLLRWRLDDGRYEVILGDLRAETVTAERLRALEGK